MSGLPRQISSRVVWPLAGGLALGLSFPPSPVPLLAAVAWLPLLHAWRASRGAREAYVAGLLFHGACFAIAFSWPLRHELLSAAAASAAPLLILPAVLAAPPAVGRIVAYRSGGGVGLFSVVMFQLLAEAGLTYGPLAMPWPLLGNALAEAWPFRMLAALGGVALLSAFLLATNALLYLTATATGRVRWFSLASFFALVGGAYFLSARPGPPATSRSIDVAVVQPALPAADWADVDDRSRVSVLAAMTESLYAAPGPMPDLTVWPETALPPCSGAVICPDVSAALASLTRPDLPPILTGAIASDAQAPDRLPWHNAVLMIRQGRPAQRYDKIRLVPFAEGVPFADRFPMLSALAIDAGGVASYRAGTERPLFRVGDLTLGALVCFESIFPQDGRAYANAGADVLVVVSQDGWWGRSYGHRQHLAFSRLRAVEAGRWVVVVSASGISAVIDPQGALAAAIPFGQRRAIRQQVGLAAGTTLYARLGDWVTALAMLGAAASVVIAVRRRQKR